MISVRPAPLSSLLQPASERPAQAGGRRSAHLDTRADDRDLDNNR